MAVLIWTAVPVEHFTPEMLAFRATAEPMRACDNTIFIGGRVTEQWQAGGVVVLGYASLEAAQHAKELLAGVYIARSGHVAIRYPP